MEDTRWRRILSNDGKIVRDAIMLCEAAKVTWSHSKRLDLPPGIYIFSDGKTYWSIANRLGFRRDYHASL